MTLVIGAHWRDVTKDAQFQHGDESHARAEVLYGPLGDWRAQLESFTSAPELWYGNAVDSEGNSYRSGAIKGEGDCREWCEYTSGLRKPH